MAQPAEMRMKPVSYTHLDVYKRQDLIWDGGAARCFEVDVSPGMTERSLFPMACAAAGLSLPAVLDTLVNEAYARGACF